MSFEQSDVEYAIIMMRSRIAPEVESALNKIQVAHKAMKNREQNPEEDLLKIEQQYMEIDRVCKSIDSGRMGVKEGLLKIRAELGDMRSIIRENGKIQRGIYADPHLKLEGMVEDIMEYLE